MNKELRINLLKQACEDIKENADVISIIKPIYNFKASDA